jgi:hypothetical protein
MERERHTRSAADQPPIERPPASDALSDIRQQCEQLLDAADQMLDSIQLDDAELFLNSNRQLGGQ